LIHEQIVQPLAEMIAMLRDENPGVVILMGHLPFNDGAALAIRPRVEQMARDISTDRSPVMTVPLYEGWREDPKLPDTDTFDWAHPNPQGQAKMAIAWFKAMRRFLNGPS
jgi:hypothetical protein